MWALNPTYLKPEVWKIEMCVISFHMRDMIHSYASICMTCAICVYERDRIRERERKRMGERGREIMREREKLKEEIKGA